jgi:hypothetical protein
MRHYIKPTLSLNPKHIIIHTGTNDLKTKTPADIVRDMASLGKLAKQHNSEMDVSLSEVIVRNDKSSLNNKYREVNKLMSDLCEQENWGLIENNNINNAQLNSYGLHLNKRGSSVLANNFKIHIVNNC